MKVGKRQRERETETAIVFLTRLPFSRNTLSLPRFPLHSLTEASFPLQVWFGPNKPPSSTICPFTFTNTNNLMKDVTGSCRETSRAKTENSCCDVIACCVGTFERLKARRRIKASLFCLPVVDHGSITRGALWEKHPGRTYCKWA